MKEYKIVKKSEYNYVYDVYKKTLGLWHKIGHCSTISEEDEDILKKAKQITSPKTLYFSE